jgi:hypothetical protein
VLRRSSALLLFALLSLVAACGDDGASAPDAGIVFDAGFVVAPAALPVLTPCPAGWREVPPASVGAPATCEPYGEVGPETCARGSAHFPGTAGCAHLGPACPVGDYAEDLPVDREVRYVRPSADLAGVGTLARPYGTLAQAASAAPAGAVLALAKGTYREAVAFPPKDLTLIGACVEETILEAPVPATDVAIVGGGSGRVEFRRVTFTGASPAVTAIDTAVFDLEDVLVERASFVALYALLGGQITGRRVVITDTQLVGGYGRAIYAEQGGVVSLTSAVLSAHHEMGAMAIDPGSRVTLEDTRITGTRPNLEGLYGRALDVEEGATLTLTRSLLDDNADYGVFCGAAGAVATLTDVVIRDMQLDAHGEFGRGLHAQGGGAIRASRVLVDGAHEVGIHATAPANPPGDALALDDVVIRDVGPNSTDFQGGRGLQAQWGASITAHRLYVSDTAELGVLIATDGTSAVLEDVTVADMRGSATRRLGQGISAIELARLTLRRAHVAHALDIGVMIAGGAQLTAEDLTVEQIESELDRGEGGIGLYARGAVIDATRTLVRDVRQLGVAADGAGARLTATSLVVDGVRDAACAQTTCSDHPSGIGLGAYVAGAELRVTGFSIAHCALVGVQLAGGVADLAGGRIADNPIGANVQTPGFDFARLAGEVTFERNERAVDGALLPIPDSRLPGALAF